MAQLGVQRGVAILTSFLFPLVATLAPKGTVIVLSVAGVASLAFALRERRLPEIFSRRALLVFLLIVGWLVYKSVDSNDPEGAILRLSKIVLVMMLGMATIWFYRTRGHDVQDQVLRACLLGSSVALALIIYGIVAIQLDIPHPFPTGGRSDRLSALNTGLVCVGALLPICVMYLWENKKRYAAVSAGLFLFAVAIASDTLAVSVSIVVTALIMVCLLKWDGVAIRRVMTWGLFAVVLSTPWSAPFVLDRISDNVVTRTADGQVVKASQALGSIVHRYEIWQFVADKAEEKPVSGWGFNSSRSMPGGDEELDTGKERLPLHPHNGVLQIWLELGYIGIILLALLIPFSFIAVAGKSISTPGFTARGGTIIFLFTAANITFGIWQSWWLATILLSFAIACAWEKDALIGGNKDVTKESNAERA